MRSRQNPASFRAATSIRDNRENLWTKCVPLDCHVTEPQAYGSDANLGGL
jgi:hypothetical protein